MNTLLFIERAKEVHGDKYTYDKVEYVNPKVKVNIICKDHGEFAQIPYGHLSGKGCVKCAINRGKKALRIPFEEFVARARKQFGEKYIYDRESYIDISSKIKIMCPLHGIFESTGSNHLNQIHGCDKCGTFSCATKKLLTQNSFLDKCKLKHGDTYDYTHVDYSKGSDKIKIICKKHGIFEQVASKHLYNGCRKCADELHASKSRKTTDEYIKEAKYIWGETYDYSLTNYINSNIKIKIICKIHGVFEKIPYEHLKQGCQLCKPPTHSNISIQWLNYMKVKDNENIQHNNNHINNGEHRIKNSLYHADGYCKETNTIYEFHGSYWHGDPKMYDMNKRNAHVGKTFGELYQNTLKKMEHCKKEGYTVKECWESEWIAGVKVVKLLQRKFRSLKIK